MNSTCLQTLADFETVSQAVERVRQTLSFATFKTLMSYEKASVSAAAAASTVAETSPLSIYLVYFVRFPLYLLLVLAALVGNTLVAVVIGANRSLVSKSSDRLMLNMCVCNLLIAVSGLSMEFLVGLNAYWPFGEWTCKLNAYVKLSALTASALTVMCIAFQRLAATLSRHGTGGGGTGDRASALRIACVWAVSLCVSVPSYTNRTYTERHWSDFVERFCDDLGWPILLVAAGEHGSCSRISRPGKRFYYSLTIGLFYMAPMVLAGAAFALATVRVCIGDTTSRRLQAKNNQTLVTTALRNAASGDANAAATSVDNDNEMSRPTAETDTSGHEQHREQCNNTYVRKKHALSVFLVMFATFVTCWTPLEAITFYGENVDEVPAWFANAQWIAYMLAYSNSAIMPLVYISMSESYQRGYRRLRERIISTVTANNQTSLSLASFDSRFITMSVLDTNSRGVSLVAPAPGNITVAVFEFSDEAV